MFTLRRARLHRLLQGNIWKHCRGCLRVGIGLSIPDALSNGLRFGLGAGLSGKLSHKLVALLRVTSTDYTKRRGEIEYMVKKLNRNAPHLTFCRGDLLPIFTRNSTAFWLLMIHVPVLNFRYILNPDSMALFSVLCVCMFHIPKK